MHGALFADRARASVFFVLPDEMSYALPPRSPPLLMSTPTTPLGPLDHRWVICAAVFEERYARSLRDL